MKNIKIVSPRYQQIAIDIASKIAAREYQVGEKIYSRSIIAGNYGVSSETARRAISILCGLGIVEAEKGSGVVIRSPEKARGFVRQCEEIETLGSLKQQIQAEIRQQQEGLARIEGQMERLADKLNRFQSSNPFLPFEIVVEAGSGLVGKSLGEVNFWNQTFATVVAIRSGSELTMSPGPLGIIQAGDTIYFVGDEDAYERVKGFLRSV